MLQDKTKIYSQPYSFFDCFIISLRAITIVNKWKSNLK